MYRCDNVWAGELGRSKPLSWDGHRCRTQWSAAVTLQQRADHHTRHWRWDCSLLQQARCKLLLCGGINSSQNQFGCRPAMTLHQERLRLAFRASWAVGLPSWRRSCPGLPSQHYSCSTMATQHTVCRACPGSHHSRNSMPSGSCYLLPAGAACQPLTQPHPITEGGRVC